VSGDRNRDLKPRNHIDNKKRSYKKGAFCSIICCTQSRWQAIIFSKGYYVS